MKTAIAAFIGGLGFAIGLGLAGMTQPDRIIGFLDFFGAWDPTLAFVMAGAVATYLLVMRLVARQPRPFASDKFRIPTRRDIDVRLVVGAAIFGAGWGLSGYCPGPGLTSIGALQLEGLAFVAAMIGGMLLYRSVERRKERRASSAAALATAASQTVSTAS